MLLALLFVLARSIIKLVVEQRRAIRLPIPPASSRRCSAR
jgi:hypothetical protein